MASLTKCAVDILDEKYEAADLPNVVAENCSHLPSSQQVKLHILLEAYKDLLDRTRDDFQTEPTSLKLKAGAKLHHNRSFLILNVHLDTLKKG